MPKINLQVVVLHLAAWILFFTLPIVFIRAQSSGQAFSSFLFSGYAFIFAVTFLFIFYFHTYFLIPLFYREKRFFLYIMALLVLVFAVWQVEPFDQLMRTTMPQLHQGPLGKRSDWNERRPADGRSFDANRDRPDDPEAPGSQPPHRGDEGPGSFGRRGRHFDLVSFFLLIMTLTFSFTLQFRQQARAAEKKSLQALADKAEAELFFLKAQIHPHFLFNTLNNIYSMSVRNDPNTSSSILRLSNILRYTTDDASNNFVPLQSEVDFLHDYVDLQRLRLGEKMEVSLTIEGDVSRHKIAPLLLLTFIENAFKYGVSNRQNSTIIIRVIAAPDRIGFFCRNDVFDTPRNAERTGIGLANTRQRLQQLYPQKHELDISLTHTNYSVQLTLLT